MVKKICFVGSDVYPVLNSEFGTAYVGGESVQKKLLAEAFKELGYEVSLVDKDYGQPDAESIDGIKVCKTFKKNSGIPVFRFLHPRLTSIVKALKKADADVYYQSCAGMTTGVVAWFCKKNKKTFIFRTAHDTDCIPGEQLISLWRDKKIYEYGLKNAHIIAVQGFKQQQLLKKKYKLNSIPVNMAVEIPDDEGDPPVKEIDVLWVNNMRPFKRPGLAIDLAKLLPEYRFVMIGGPCAGLDTYYQKIEKAAQHVSNLDFIGPVNYNKVNEYFLKAKVFVNTSETEGYPNSFLQAWIRKVSVVSFFDPDDLIVSNNLGCSPSSLENMAEAVDDLLRNKSKRLRIGERAKSFTMKHYSPVSVASHYLRLINESN